MSIATAAKLTVPNDVLAEVRRKSAEVEFESFRQALLDHFPDARAIELRLREDPDELDRNRVVFDVTVSPTISADCLRQREIDFYAELELRRPHIAWPLCVLSVWYAEESA